MNWESEKWVIKLDIRKVCQNVNCLGGGGGEITHFLPPLQATDFESATLVFMKNFLKSILFCQQVLACERFIINDVNSRERGRKTNHYQKFAVV